MAKSTATLQSACRLGWIREIHKIESTPISGLRDWLFSETYAFQTAPNNKSFAVFIPNKAGLLQSYAYDISRMACSAFETILSISPVETMRRSLAWLSIMLYYSSFYSAHAFTRMQGVSCTQIDSREAGRLASTSQAYGYPPGNNISAGFHTITFDERIAKLQFSPANAGGGSHETLWIEYSKSLNRLQDNINASSLLAADRIALTAKLTAAKRVLALDGSKNGNWLSRVRNEINYRHSKGVWWPHPSSNNADKVIGLIRSSLKCDPMSNDLPEQPTLDAFLCACLFVINLTRVSIIDMAALNENRSSFQETGPMVVLRRGRIAN